MDREHSDLTKLHVLIQHGHTSEVEHLRVQSRRMRLEARLQRITHRQERLDRQANMLQADRLVSTTRRSPGELSHRFPHWARQNSRSMYRQDRKIERLEARTSGLRARLEKVLQGLRQTQEKTRDDLHNLGR